jgi:hypothetical protein
MLSTALAYSEISPAENKNHQDQDFCVLYILLRNQLHYTKKIEHLKGHVEL